MNLWRLEVLRLARTHRWAILVGVYAFFGLIGPLTARFLGDIMGRFAGDIVMDVPAARPVDGLAQFVSNATQIGVLAVVVVAAGTLAVDARPEVAAFLRTRVVRARQLLWPRYVVVTVTAVGSLLVGTLIAWGATGALIGGLPAGALAIGTLFGAVYLAFAVAVLAAIAGSTKGTVSMVFAGLVVLLALPILGLFPALDPWLPSRLVSAVLALVEGVPASEFLRSLLVTLALTAALLALAARRFEQREL